MRVRVLISFNGFKPGEEAEAGEELGPVVEGYVALGLMVVDDGTSEAGPGGHPAGYPGGEHERVAPGGSDGGEPGQDPVSG
jgi:hypothetical protein